MSPSKNIPNRRLKRLLPIVLRDCADVRWFIGRFVQKASALESPLMRTIQMYERLDGSEPSKSIEEIELSPPASEGPISTGLTGARALRREPETGSGSDPRRGFALRG